MREKGLEGEMHQAPLPGLKAAAQERVTRRPTDLADSVKSVADVLGGGLELVERALLAVVNDNVGAGGIPSAAAPH